MAEHPGDLGQGHTDLDHLAGKRVAKPVCPNDRHIGTRTRAPHDARDPIRAERPDRRDDSQEHLTMHRAVRAAPSQVGDDRLTDVAWQRKALHATALAVNRNLAGPPVDVLQAQAGNLPGPQPETKQDKQNGVVPPALRPPPVTRVKQGVNSAPVDPHGQRRSVPPWNGQRRRGQLVWHQPLREAETQERAQRGHKQLRRAQ